MNKKSKHCPICGSDATLEFKIISDKEAPIYQVNCPLCGNFYIAAHIIDDITEEEKVKLKYFYYTTPKDDEEKRYINYIKSETTKKELLKKINAPKNLLDKIERVLIYVYEKSKYYGENIILSFKEAQSLFFCISDEELRNIFNILKEAKYINASVIQTGEHKVGKYIHIDAGWSLSITAKGLEKAIGLTSNINSSQCFVAMWFSDKTKEIYKRIKIAVEGKSNVDKMSNDYGAGYKAFKIDDKLHANYIPPEIISEIKRSKFMIADLTGYRGGVYYEAGFAEGLKIPVIYTCSKDWFEDKTTTRNGKIKIKQNGVHFDLKQKNIIIWEDNKLNEFQRTLVATIGEIVGFNN